ncbi:hypothetical protein SAMN04515672_1101 [Natronorubrum texcoconense]|uniref:Uncharacterized protein n=2 Tax=Natronorubrum texcoconense TaxID=1095776 RepID=A0A1G8UZE4_9EURY|nr:hypothetical protein SAMN04515672_1101 [Natronorubrum texcoconense]
MMSEICLQWSPEHGPRRKLTITPTDSGWAKIAAVWDGSQWHETSYDLIQAPTISAPDHADENPTPRILETLIEQINHTWDSDTPQVLAFDSPNPIVIAARDEILRSYSARSTCWQPIEKPALEPLIRDHGLPSVTPLAETPYSRSQLERGEPNGR